MKRKLARQNPAVNKRPKGPVSLTRVQSVKNQKGPNSEKYMYHYFIKVQF